MEKKRWLEEYSLEPQAMTHRKKKRPLTYDFPKQKLVTYTCWVSEFQWLKLGSYFLPF